MDKAKNRRNTLCISRFFNAVQRKKIRRLGVLTFFKQALSEKEHCFSKNHRPKYQLTAPVPGSQSAFMSKTAAFSFCRRYVKMEKYR
ncbi:MAG: hypothetical protein K2O84_05625 [Oscillospiraceae bacterium]|nr:hypothetical protein [Oscillospiraceae bacterium]